MGRSGVWIWGGIIALAAISGMAIAAFPMVGLLLPLGLFGLVVAWVVVFRLSVRWMLFVFIFSAFVSSWLLPLASLGGLNLRPSQVLLVLIMLGLWLRAPVWDGRLRLGPYMSLGLWLWTATLFFTVVNALLGTLTSQSPSILGPLSHVALLGINLAHAGLAYTLVKRTGALKDAIRWVFISLIVMVLLTLLSLLGARAGLGSLMGTGLEGQPILADGELQGATIERLSYGVATGSISAAVVVMVLCLIIAGKRKHHLTLWGGVFLGMIGVVFGVARAALVTLVLGAVIVGLASWRRLFRFLFVALGVVLLVWGALWVMGSLWGSEFLLPAAFLGRASLLLEPGSYATGTVEGRLTLWSSMVSDFLSNPFWGYGQDSFAQYLPPGMYGSHNQPLEVLHASGLWGFIPYFLMQLRAGWRAWRKVRLKGRADSERSIALALLAGYAGLWLAATTNLVFWSPAYWVIFGLLMAVGDSYDSGAPSSAPVKQRPQ